ncbi:MAG TPA: cyclase family protein [Ktedonobacteraceae bacterium]|nr:cyclase family protein [Ktedonobacteraceae bacterium]
MQNVGNSILAQLVAELASGRLKVVDLTTPLGPETTVIELPPVFAQSPGVTITEISRYDSNGPAWYWNILNLGEHTGTHFDAPIHWVTGKDLPNNATDTILPQKFIGPACVIGVTTEVEQNPDFLLTIERVEQWEREHGRIPAGAWVLMRTGWSKFTDHDAFLGLREDGAHTPGFHKTCSEFLAIERDILGVGVETVGTDAGQAGGFDPPFPNHTTMHGHGKFGITSLVNLDQLPATGAVVIAAPLKIVNGSGSPLRVIAITE